MRVKIDFPTTAAQGIFKIPVRITDINYGNHLGNDALLGILHEARMQWLQSGGFTELTIGSHGLIMADVMIAYKAEAFYGDVLDVAIFIGAQTAKGFDLLYRVYTERAGNYVRIAEAKSGMLCFDYSNRKICNMDPAFQNFLGTSAKG